MSTFGFDRDATKCHVRRCSMSRTGRISSRSRQFTNATFCWPLIRAHFHTGTMATTSFLCGGIACINLTSAAAQDGTHCLGGANFALFASRATCLETFFSSGSSGNTSQAGCSRNYCPAIPAGCSRWAYCHQAAGLSAVMLAATVQSASLAEQLLSSGFTLHVAAIVVKANCLAADAASLLHIVLGVPCTEVMPLTQHDPSAPLEASTFSDDATVPHLVDYSITTQTGYGVDLSRYRGNAVHELKFSRCTPHALIEPA